MYSMSTLKSQKRSIFLSICFAICLLIASADSTHAATFTVLNTNDSGAGSLRQAILDANASTEDDVINFELSDCPCVITLTTGVLSIASNDSLTVNGPGADQLSVSGNGISGVFYIGDPSNVTNGITAINGITVTGSRGSGRSGIIIRSGRLALADSTVSGNSAQHGGGIFNDRGTLTLTNSTITDNSAYWGGGILNDGTLTLINSTVSGNSANTGGGIFNIDTLTLSNSTVTGNSATSSGGGIFLEAGVMTLNNTIIANSSGGDCGVGVNGSPFSDASYSLVEDGSCGLTGVGNLTGDPNLGPLVDNGGPTLTHALLEGSIAIDAGDPAYVGPLTTDQRGTGFDRIVGGRIDMGAFEVQPEAVSFTVTNTNDSGPGSLRQAILNANLSPDDNVIDFDLSCSPCTITLTSGELLIDNNGTLTISGLGANQLSVSGNNVSRVFLTQPDVNLTINGLTISGGAVTGTGGAIYMQGALTLNDTIVSDNSASEVGGGIYNGGGTVTLNNTAVSDNSASGDGGGIYNFMGTMTLNNSTVSGNSTTGNGGGIYNNGTLTLTDSTVSGNSASGDGGGIYNNIVFPFDTTGLTLFNTTVSNNRTGQEGGGIYSYGRLILTNSTVSGNSASSGGGGGIFDNDAGNTVMTVTNSTVANNTATFGAGIASYQSGFNIGNSIVAGNTGSSDVTGPFDSQGYNLIGNGDGSSGFTAAGDQVGTVADLIDPLLGTLQNNGGPTFTHAPLCGSPAVDAGVANAFAFDQRGAGFARTFDDPATANAADGDGTDIGSFELQEALVCNIAPVANDDSYSMDEDTTLTVVAPGVLENDTDGEDDTLTADLVDGPAHGSITLNADGSFSYTPAANFNGTDAFTYKANDGSLDSNVATVTITVNPVNDAPVISLTPASQSVQYSDAIETVRISGSDVDTPYGGLSVSFSYVRNGGDTLANLPTGLFSSGFAGEWTVSGMPSVSAGTYVVTATVSDGDHSASDTFTIVVTRENATVTPSATNPASVKVNTPGGTAGPITLCADIADAADGSPGYIQLAFPVTFELTPVVSGPSLQLQATTPSVGTACATFSNVAVNVYDVTITVGGDYYTGAGSSVLAVFDPTLGFTTGGGKVLNPSTGNVLHFGFSFKYDKKSFKGQMLVMEHLADGSVVKLKSNSLTSLSIVGKQAIVLGKANIADVGGNLNFRLNVTDNGEPGSSDLFGLKTTTPGGATIDAFSIDPPRTLLGGNIQVPQGARN